MMKKALSTICMAGILLSSCQQNPEQPKETDTVIADPDLWKKTASIYEVNIRQYTPEGTINAFIPHMERLAEMGVGILWIMPVQPIGEKNRKGDLGSYYSISDYTAVNPEFGIEEDFQIMVEKAHELGMRVILDWVANHTAFDHHWITDHPDYYTLTEDGQPSVAIDNNGTVTDWTDVADLNYDNPEMRDAMVQEMLWWVEKFDVDGFRCDVAGFVPHSFWQEAIPQLREARDVFMLAEWDEPYLHDMFDMTYGWEFHHLTNQVAANYRMVEDKDDYVFQPLSVFDDFKAKLDTTYPDGAMKMLFTTNHDENSWNGTVYERYGDGHKALFVLCATFEDGMPLVYSGQEAGLNHRLSFFGKDQIDWTDLSLAAFYETTLKTKTANPALWNAPWGGAQTRLNTTANDKVYAFVRRVEGNDVAVFINLSPDDVSFEYEGVPANTYEEVYSGNLIDLGGPGTMDLEPWGFMVFSNRITAAE